MTPLRTTGDEQQAAQRFSASQARTEQAALNGDLGVDSQLTAMSELYFELRAAGKLEAAAIVKGRALAINAGRR